jgi:hypothetical protein
MAARLLTAKCASKQVPGFAGSLSTIATGGTVEIEASYRFRLLATMVQGTAATLPEAWQSYRTLGGARSAAREMVQNHRVLRVAIVEDRMPMQFVEWVGR